MKRFLEKKIVTADTLSDLYKAVPGSDILKPTLDPNSPEGQKASKIDGLEDSQKSLVIQRAENIVQTNVENRNEAVSIFKIYGKSEDFYNTTLKNAFEGFSIPNLQFNQYIIGLWPMMRDKNFSFDKFLQILFLVADRYKSPKQIDSFFKNFIGVLPGLEKTLGTSDEVINKAVDFLTQDKGAEEFQEYLMYQMLLRYGLYDEIPQNKKSEIFKATETLEKVRQNINSTESLVQQYLIRKAEFLQAQNKWFEDNSLVFLSIQYYNMDDVQRIFEKGIDDESIRFYIENFRKGAAFNLFEMSSPLSSETLPESSTGAPVGVNSKGANSLFKRKVFAQDPQSSAEEAGQERIQPGEQSERQTLSTDSKSVSEEYGELFVLIQQFETNLQFLSKRMDDEIKFIIDKQANSSSVGPFKSGLVFTYLQDEEESIKETDRIIDLGNDVIEAAQRTLSETNEKFDRFVEIGKASQSQKEKAQLLINEKYKIFIKEIRSKQLNLKFNKVLLLKYNEYSEAEDLYNNLKIDMENNVSVRPIIAPKAVVAGFRMADIIESIAEEFKQIAGNNLLRKEQASRTARQWENLAKQQRASVFAEIYPAMAQSIGIEATKPTISPSFSLRGAFVDNVFNSRFAGKFMDKEVESDKRFRDYWNNLFMQSKDPRPMGDIIEEKPKHGNLTTEEDAKLHKKTMRKFKKHVSKKPRFKKDNN